MKSTYDLERKISNGIDRVRLLCISIEDLISRLEISELEEDHYHYGFLLGREKELFKKEIIKLNKLECSPDRLKMIYFDEDSEGIKRYHVSTLLFFLLVEEDELCEFLIENDFYTKNDFDGIFRLIECEGEYIRLRAIRLMKILHERA